MLLLSRSIRCHKLRLKRPIQPQSRTWVHRPKRRTCLSGWIRFRLSHRALSESPKMGPTPSNVGIAPKLSTNRKRLVVMSQRRILSKAILTSKRCWRGTSAHKNERSSSSQSVSSKSCTQTAISMITDGRSPTWRSRSSKSWSNNPICLRIRS